jgi:hypothetical protein
MRVIHSPVWQVFTAAWLIGMGAYAWNVRASYDLLAPDLLSVPIDVSVFVIPPAIIASMLIAISAIRRRVRHAV